MVPFRPGAAERPRGTEKVAQGRDGREGRRGPGQGRLTGPRRRRSPRRRSSLAGPRAALAPGLAARSASPFKGGEGEARGRRGLVHKGHFKVRSPLFKGFTDGGGAKERRRTSRADGPVGAPPVSRGRGASGLRAPGSGPSPAPTLARARVGRGRLGPRVPAGTPRERDGPQVRAGPRGRDPPREVHRPPPPPRLHFGSRGETKGETSRGRRREGGRRRRVDVGGWRGDDNWGSRGCGAHKSKRGCTPDRGLLPSPLLGPPHTRNDKAQTSSSTFPHGPSAPRYDNGSQKARRGRNRRSQWSRGTLPLSVSPLRDEGPLKEGVARGGYNCSTKEPATNRKFQNPCPPRLSHQVAPKDRWRSVL